MESPSEECIPTLCCVEEHHSLGGRRPKLLHDGKWTKNPCNLPVIKFELYLTYNWKMKFDAQVKRHNCGLVVLNCWKMIEEERMGEKEKILRTLVVYIYCGKSYQGLLGCIIGKCEVVVASHSGNCSCWGAELSPETRDVLGSMQTP